MLFERLKVYNLQELCILIKSVQTGLAYLTQRIIHLQEAEQIFDQVEVNSKEVQQNMMMHSHKIGQLAKMLTPKDCKVNVKTIHQILIYLQNWLEKNYREDQNQTIKQKVVKIMQIESKLCCLQEFLVPALTYQDDIAAFPLGSQPKYSRTYSLIEVNEPLSFEELQQQYEKMRKLMIVTNAAVLTELNQSYKILSVMAFGLSYPRFMVDINTAKIRNFAFLRKPSLQKLSSIWNLPQNGAISGLKYVNFPYIHTNTMIYIPQDESKMQKCDLFSNLDQESIGVRILSNRPITFCQKNFNCCSYSPNRIQLLENVIIHAHGGGFIALSSSTMQNQTRIWSKELDVVVLSIDYKKPPNYRFPAPVYDFYNVYSFVCKHIQNFCNISPKKIILAGDSAGGNLVLSATALAMKANLPQPHGIFLAYPASDLRSCYTPSRIHAFEDAILHPSLLLLCMHEYLGQNRKQIQNDPIASPILISQSFIGGNRNNKGWPSKWPITRIIVGQNDPLLDDSLKLCHRMSQSGVDVRCTIFRGLGHGFLSVQKIIKQGQRGIQKSLMLLRQMLQRQ